jgi:hypothetical protein
LKKPKTPGHCPKCGKPGKLLCRFADQIAYSCEHCHHRRDKDKVLVWKEGK